MIIGTGKSQSGISRFLSECIDRGKSSLDVLKTVKFLVDCGDAIALLGNHEFNAVLYHTLRKNHRDIAEEVDKYCRPHTEKNVKQHLDTLDDFKRHEEDILPWVDWLKSLPLFYETDEFLAIHACPVTHDLVELKKLLKTHDNSLSEEFIQQAAYGNCGEHQIVENLLKGPEIALPKGISFHDKDGHVRKSIRLNWWNLFNPAKKITNWFQLALSVPDKSRIELEKEAVSQDLLDELTNTYRIPKEKMIFVGHYWLKGIPEKMSESIVCLDYSVARKGALVCFSMTKKGKGEFYSEPYSADCADGV